MIQCNQVRHIKGSCSMYIISMHAMEVEILTISVFGRVTVSALPLLLY